MASRSIIIWAARPSRISRCCRKSQWRRCARTRRSTRSATSAAASPPASARCSTPRRSRSASKAIVFGLGGIGLNVIQGLKLAGADMIIGVDLNNDRKAWGERFGMTHFVNPKEIGKDLVPYLVDMTKTGRRPDRRRRLHLRLHRQCHGDAAGAGSVPSRLGRLGGDRRRARRARRFPPGRSSWSPDGSGKARPSAAPEAAPTCRRSSTGTWTRRFRSIR